MSTVFERGIYPIWIASYPRSGNTFLRIILETFFRLPSYSLYNVEGQTYKDPSAEALGEAPFLPQNWRERISHKPQGGLVLIKTHDPPEDASPAIFIVRDGRAAIDSYYHYHKKYAFEQPSLTEVIAGACQFGSWSEHCRAWKPKTRPNTLLLRYEQLVHKPETVIPLLSEFLKVKTIKGRLPSFEELQSRQPAFFRRGDNRDFLSLWSPGQTVLFNQLHGPVMEELGYALSAVTDSGLSIAIELSNSAARLHRLYEEQLSKLGHTAIANETLKKEIARLSEELARIPSLAEIEKKVLNNPWVRLGMAVGAVQAVRKGNGRA
jgi:hypothetical protein